MGIHRCRVAVCCGLLFRMLGRVRMNRVFCLGPIRRSIIETPHICGTFEFDGDLEKITNRMRPLDPRDTRAQVCTLAGCGACLSGLAWRALRQIQRDPGISRQMVLGGVPASVQIEREREGVFFERLAQKINTAHRERKGFNDALAAAALGTRLARIHFCTGSHEGFLTLYLFVSRDVRENNTVAIANREKKASQKLILWKKSGAARSWLKVPPSFEKMAYFFFLLPTDSSWPPFIAVSPSSASLHCFPTGLSAPRSMHF